MASRLRSQTLTNGRAATPAVNGAEPDNPFPYGWRYVIKNGANSSVEFEQIPLTLADVLHPKEGDVIPETPRHEKERRYLTDVLETRRSRRKGYHVFSDQLVDWGIPGRKPIAPDVTAFDRLRSEPDATQGIFRIRKHGGRCLLAVEIVSPETRSLDVGPKLKAYHQARVAIYVIVDWLGTDHPRKLTGYRYQRDRYARMRLDQEGCLRIASLGIRLGLRDEWLVCYDDISGKKLGDYDEVNQRLQAAQQALQAAEDRIRELEAKDRHQAN
jgi:Uma2 family endonuclease